MRMGPFLDRFWRRPPTREGRNEQKKSAAAVFNAAAITLVITGFFGPAINPNLAPVLDLGGRASLVLASVAAHIVARAILWSLEDK